MSDIDRSETAWEQEVPLVEGATRATAQPIPRTLEAISESLDLMGVRVDSLAGKLSVVMPRKDIADGDVPGPPMGSSLICNDLGNIHARIQILSAKIYTLDVESEL